MYTYYKEVKSKEHMLYTTEIAQLAGIYSIKDKPAVALVREILNDYISTLDNYEQCYYLSGGYNRKNKVYPKDIYVPAIINFFVKINEEHGENIPPTLTAKYKNKNYVYKIKQDIEEEEEN